MYKKSIINLFICLIIALAFANVTAQEEEKKPEFGWKNQVVGDLNLTQNQFDNWSQGGENSLTWQLLINAKFENDQEKYNWVNSGKLQFGKTKLGSGDARKSADEINLESVYTYKFGENINPYVALKAHTQFADGFDYSASPKLKTSGSFDPLYLTESIGVGLKPNEHIKTRIGAAFKQTLSDKKFGYADDKSTAKIEETKSEIGAESVTELNLSVSERIVYDSKLEIFSDLDALNKVDVNWDNTFSAKVSDIIKVSLNFAIFYDRDISNKRQFKETLAIGLSYTFL